MAFSPPAVGCLVKKGLQKGGVTGTPGPPLATPLPHYLGVTLPIHLNAELLIMSTVVVLCSSNMVLLLSEVNQ